MKQILFFLSVFTFQIGSGQNKDYPIKPVPFNEVKLTDNFWLPRLMINESITIPASFERCEKSGRVRNFVMAAARSGKFCTLYPFDDTDIYKTIEGASYSLSLFPDPKLERYVDSLITIIGAAQEPDGYLYTARTINPNDVGQWVGKVRWEKERELSHELYDAGHMYEAAVAYYLATGKKSFLDIALKNADLVCSVFGPDKKHVAPGHEVVEMGLVKLYRVTGNEKYLKTARFFVEERGHYKGYDSTSKDEWKNGIYWQDDKPVIDQTEAEGHAVRAGYLYSAMADVAALTGDDSLLHAVDTIWRNLVSKKLYVQGGAGAVGDGERYGDNYELPNTTAYNETCAAIANVFWNERMFLLHGDSKYIDVLEKILYNGLISGVSLDGKSFFYTNAMQITNNFSHPDMEPERSGWFPCSCCPTNVVRLLPSVPGYIYAQKDDQLYVNLFISSKISLKIQNKQVEIDQQNNYPWDGDLTFRVSPNAPISFTMMIRIPGWAQNEAIPSDLYSFLNNDNKKTVITINGKEVTYDIKNGYAVLNRTWRKNDILRVNLPMEVRKVVANKNVKNDLGKVALQRGPIIYCAEWVDNNGRVSNLIVPADTKFTAEYMTDILNGIEILKATVPAVVIGADEKSVQTENRQFIAIPYYAWANRGKGEMMIWFPEQVKDIQLVSNE